jgi:dihydroxy-acid dehydratase
MTEDELEKLVEVACPGCGSCAGMFTANTMNCLTEAMGMGLPGHGTIPAVDSRRIDLAREAGKQIMSILAADTCPRDVITADSLRNAFLVDMALGGSTNSVLHLMAIAHEAGVEYPLREINEISEHTPTLCKIRPAGAYHIEDLDRAGGISAVMKELRSFLNLDIKTVTGRTVADIVDSACVKDSDVIRSVNTAYSNKGGLAVLFGNLAPMALWSRGRRSPPR